MKSPRRDLIKIVLTSRQARRSLAEDGSLRVGTAARGWEGEMLGMEQAGEEPGCGRGRAARANAAFGSG